MTKYGNMVLWMGLILMALQIAAEWSQIRAAIFTNSSGSASGGSGGFGFPTGPNLLFPPSFGLLATPQKQNVGNLFPKIGPPPGRQ